MKIAEYCKRWIEEKETVRIWSQSQEKVLFEGTYREAADSTYGSDTFQSAAYGLDPDVIYLTVA